MPKYSILMWIHAPDQGRLQAAIDSVTAQTLEDWELVLVGRPEELLEIALTDDRIRTVLAKPEDTLAQVTNRLLASLGSWIGCLGQADRLLPEALTKLDLGLSAMPGARVLFTDEESRNWFGQLSMRSRKGAINPLRLRSQEYLGDLVLVHRDTIVALGGFNPVTSTCAPHDLYLRILEAHGTGVFCHVPERLYQRFRDHRDPLPRVRHDQQAVQDHLARLQLPAQVRQLNHRLDIEYRFETHPWVTAVIVVEDDVAVGLRRIQRSQVGPLYRPATFRVLHVGVSPTAERAYRSLCKEVGLAYEIHHGSVPEALNFEAQFIDTELLLFLQGEAVHPRWLHRLVDHVRLPGAGAVGPRIFAGSRLHQPGIVGHSYEGWDWNTAGRFDVMAVPHQTAAVSPACLLIDTRRFLQFRFDEAYPTLYGMDLCLRLDAAGHANLLVPTSRVEVQLSPVPLPEATLLRTSWPGWRDRFNLHVLHQ